MLLASHPGPPMPPPMSPCWGDDEDAHWRSGFEPEEQRRPRVAEPSTPLQVGHGEVDFEAARPQEESLGLSPTREAACSCTGSVPAGVVSPSALIALKVVDLMEERRRIRDKDKRLHARPPRLEDSQKTYAEVQVFLTAIEGEAERVGLQNKLYELAINQMSITLAANYRRLSATKFLGLPASCEKLVETLVKSVAPGKPEGHLLIKTLGVGKTGVWPLREQLDRIYQTYL